MDVDLFGSDEDEGHVGSRHRFLARMRLNTQIGTFSDSDCGERRLEACVSVSQS